VIQAVSVFALVNIVLWGYEGLATWKYKQWWTLSELTWYTIGNHRYVAYLILGFMVVLALHLLTGFPGKRAGLL
jgi:hypothetical protein